MKYWPWLPLMTPGDSHRPITLIAGSLLTCLIGTFCCRTLAATVTREIYIDVAPAAVWDAVRDVGAVARPLAPGLVVADHLENGVRAITFANGRVVQEAIVSIDDGMRRIAYAQVGGPSTHHNACMQVLASGKGSRLIWIADMLPDTLTLPAANAVEKALAVAKATLEQRY